MTKVIDLRSDTVTKPTPEMLQTMIRAQVGDDVLMDDPTVQLLESTVAQLCGKEAALFTCSGVMGNQICLKVHLEPLAEIIVDARSHIYRNECGGIAYHSRASVMPIEPIPPLTYITAEQIEAKINTSINYHSPITRVIAIENTLNGMIFPMQELLKIRKIADKYNLALHLDGARLWNAHVATGIPIKEYGQLFDSMSLCFSKGLGAPIGSVITGSKSFIFKARQYRKLFGGGMRQVGILAAACLFSLEHILPKIHLDHENAKKLEQGILKLGFSSVVPVDTNMVYVNSTPLGIPFKYFEEYLTKKNILVLPASEANICRLVLHHQVTSEDVDVVLTVLKEAIEQLSL
jgi:threonine aldolase